MKLLGTYEFDDRCMQEVLAEIELMDQVDDGQVDDDMRWRHIDECLTAFAADTFAEIPPCDRMPLTLSVFDKFRAAATPRLLKVSLHIRVGEERTRDFGIAASSEELTYQFSQTPRWLVMPPELIIHSSHYTFVPPGSELTTAAELWGRPSNSTVVRCFHRTLDDPEDADNISHDYFFVFAERSTAVQQEG